MGGGRWQGGRASTLLATSHNTIVDTLRQNELNCLIPWVDLNLMLEIWFCLICWLRLKPHFFLSLNELKWDIGPNYWIFSQSVTFHSHCLLAYWLNAAWPRPFISQKRNSRSLALIFFIHPVSHSKLCKLCCNICRYSKWRKKRDDFS